MGKGFLDVYLKHQNTKQRKVVAQVRPSSIGVEDFARNLVNNLDQSNECVFLEDSSNSPNDQSFTYS
jgi:hypothetical protein